MKLGRTSDLRGREIAVDPDLVDRLVELYCDWRTECAAVRASYERLSGAPASERELSFAAFSAALDREGSAAEMYAAHLELVASLGTGDRPEASHGPESGENDDRHQPRPTGGCKVRAPP